MALNQARIRVELAYTKLQNTEVLAAHLQGKLGLESGWQVGDEEYNRFKEDAALAKYRQALGELERLVVMRLFELSKYAMSGTGKFFFGGPQTQTNYGMQVTSFANRLARVCSGDLRQFAKQSCGTMIKQLASLLLGHPSRGRRLPSTRSSASSIYSATPVMMFVSALGPDRPSVKLQPSISNCAEPGKRLQG